MKKCKNILLLSCIISSVYNSIIGSSQKMISQMKEEVHKLAPSALASGLERILEARGDELAKKIDAAQNPGPKPTEQKPPCQACTLSCHMCTLLRTAPTVPVPNETTVPVPNNSCEFIPVANETFEIIKESIRKISKRAEKSSTRLCLATLLRLLEKQEELYETDHKTIGTRLEKLIRKNEPQLMAKCKDELNAFWQVTILPKHPSPTKKSCTKNNSPVTQKQDEKKDNEPVPKPTPAKRKKRRNPQPSTSGTVATNKPQSYVDPVSQAEKAARAAQELQRLGALAKKLEDGEYLEPDEVATLAVQIERLKLTHDQRKMLHGLRELYENPLSKKEIETQLPPSISPAASAAALLSVTTNAVTSHKKLLPTKQKECEDYLDRRYLPPQKKEPRPSLEELLKNINDHIKNNEKEKKSELSENLFVPESKNVEIDVVELQKKEESNVPENGIKQKQEGEWNWSPFSLFDETLFDQAIAVVLGNFR